MENEYLIKCAAIGLLFIGIAWVVKQIINAVSNQPMSIMHQEFAELFEKLQSLETIEEVIEFEKDIDAFDYKYQSHDNCGGLVTALFLERQAIKNAARQALKEHNRKDTENNLQIAG